MQSQNTTEKDYSSDSSLTNHQLKFWSLGINSPAATSGIRYDTKTSWHVYHRWYRDGDIDTHKMKIQLKDQAPVQEKL